MTRKEGKEGKGGEERTSGGGAAGISRDPEAKFAQIQFVVTFFFFFFFFVSPPTYWRSAPFVGVLGFMTQDSISQRSPPLGEY